jgi:glycosyltransferase involved in cell wall biosynthesis
LYQLLGNQSFDLIWVNLSILVDILPSALIKDTPVVLDQQECEELVYKGYLLQGSLEERLFALINLIKLKKFEQRILSRISTILCVSEEEAAFMQSRVPRQVKVWTVPNGVDEEFFRPGSPLENKKNYIILCSNLSVRRNINAAVWFTKCIFPKIKEQIPDAEFWIVGSNPTSEIWKLNSISGVHVTGTVNDIRNYYAKGKVFVAPYHFGAGTKLKVLEAMASGIPIVSTTVGCQGIDVINGQHLLIANTETDFSERVIELLGNSQRAQKLAAAAQALVRDKYRWEKIVDELEPKLLELVGQGTQK